MVVTGMDFCVRRAVVVVVVNELILRNRELYQQVKSWEHLKWKMSKEWKKLNDYLAKFVKLN